MAPPLIILLPMIILLSSSISTNSFPNCTLPPDIHLLNDPDSITFASRDHGNLVHHHPRAVLYPSSLHVIIKLLEASNNCSRPFAVATRGHGHSVRGQSMARGGVVVNMPSLRGGIRVSLSGHYADVGGEQLWTDVLRIGLQYGLAPVSWIDFLYLTVGGTLSNAGISGQSFLYGPQISNVLELDVITGKGEFITCSKEMNSELFFAVLGGLGQFGIITRARIVLEKAPKRAKWMRIIYNDFSTFIRDQEHLISTDHMTNSPNYVEGSVITENSPINNWRSSFYSPSQLFKMANLMKMKQGNLYSIDLVKYYDDQTADTIDHEVEMMLKDLNFIDGFVFKKDVSFFDFLHRVASADIDPTDEAHPWLNLFVPKSRIVDFNDGVFVDIIQRQNKTSGTIIFYPIHKQKWDDRMSAVVPEGEDIFYTVGLLHTSSTSESAGVFDDLNKQILEFCEKAGIKIKQYLPHYESNEDWKKHYGSKWDTFQLRKTLFDPRMILSPGQTIFPLHAATHSQT
ncbi:hypothetical protein ACS0TY_021448 [Phlomoides rotata]